MKRVVTQMTYSRHATCMATTRVLAKHHRRLTAVLLALLLGLAIGSFLSYQEPVGDNVNKHAPDNELVVPVGGTSPLGAGSERDYMLHRPDEHGNTVRVMIMLTGTYVMDIHCYAVASAYFADLPVVLVGFGEQYQHMFKYNLFLGAANLAGLDDSDVVLALDGDIMFTGQDMLPYIDRFIAQSAPSLCELDAKAVREGRAMAPITFVTEKYCFAPHFSNLRSECMKWWETFEDSVRQFASTHNDTFHPKLNPPSNPLRHINAGVSIQRVWAMRALATAIVRFSHADTPPHAGPRWWCDQSIIHALYHDLVKFEMAHDVYFNETRAANMARTQYGLHAGILALEWGGQLATAVSYVQQEVCQVTSEQWDGRTSNILPMYDANVTEYVKKLYATTKDTVHFTHRPLTRTFSRVTSIDVSPPLLSITPYRVNDSTTVQSTLVYPYLLHFCDTQKMQRMQRSMQYMPWYLPMMLDKEQWEQGRDYLLSMPMELWNATTRARVRYADVCPQHPFSVPPTWD